MNSKLVFDVGMHNGDDTEHYLQRGYNVIAVEADPDLAAAGRERFADAIGSGRLTIVNAAIAEQRGEAEFWICDQLRVWNSFEKSIASRNGMPCHAIKVETVPLRDLLATHGVPYYLKLDIEGQDHTAASDIDRGDPPAYVSLEINSADDFFLLHSKGYRRFKCIQQGYFTPVLSPRLSWRKLVDARIKAAKSTPFANRLRSLYRKLRPSVERAPMPGVRSFPPGSSGPFGEETPGDWLSFEEALHAWLSQQLGHQLGYLSSPPSVSVWYDLHAKIG